jgi:hypothetical protein
LGTVLGFLVLQIVLGVFLEVWGQGVRDPEYAAKETRLLARLAESPDRPLILVLGSSRTFLALQAGRVQEALGPEPPLVFNFGLTGAGPLRQWLVYQRLRASGVRPAFVFLEVLPPLFNRAGGVNQEDWWLDGEQLTLGEIRAVTPWHSHPARLLRSWARSRLAPAFRHHGLGPALGEPVSSSEIGSELLRVDEHGWFEGFARPLSPQESRRRTEIAHHQYRDNLGDFRLASQPLRALEDLISCCRREGVPIALMLLPEGSRFRGWCSPAMISGYESWLTEFCRRENLPLVDARRWIGDEGFWDGHHLYAAGAVRFSERWKNEALLGLALPLLQRTGQASSHESGTRAVLYPGRPAPDTVPAE